jgi:hypothetical protein
LCANKAADAAAILSSFFSTDSPAQHASFKVSNQATFKSANYATVHSTIQSAN